MTLAILALYLVLVLLVGAQSHRFLRSTGEGYFVADRSIGPFVLLMTLFGTHMTSFALLGASAESYRVGIGVFSLMASSSALVVPVVFFFVGTRVWALGKEHGFLTQVEYFRERFQSEALGIVLFVVLVTLLVPYLLIGILGGGITLNEITGGDIPQWVGALVVSVVVVAYVSYGGMRGTAWVNTFQTLVFMILGGVTVAVVLDRMGGLGVAMARLATEQPELLIRGEVFGRIELFTYTFIPLSVGMFPHIFSHWLSAKSAGTFRAPIIFYPLCIAVVWVPSVLLGALGNLDFPGLQGPAANSILVRMIDLHAPELLSGLLAAGVLAAIMSSLDSQSLALGAMFTQDILQRYVYGGKMEEVAKVRAGRIFIAAVIAATFLLSLVARSSIFGLAVWSFTGFAALFPIVVAALYWRRASAAGALSAVFTVVALWIFFFSRGWGSPGYTVADSGVMPVAVMFLVSTVVLIGVSLVTAPPEEARLARFFPQAPRSSGR